MWRAATLSTLFALGAASAGAQSNAPPTGQPGRWEDHGFVSVNGGYQATSTTFRDTITMTRFAEPGSIDTSYKVNAAPAFDVSGGLRLWKNLGVGIGVSRYRKAGDAPVTAQIPHPFFFNQLRAISGQANGLTREELAVHVDALVVLPASPRFQVAVFGGPTFFHVKQGLVSDVAYSDAYPYDSAQFQSATITRQTKSKTGFNAGADLTFLVARHVGVGALVRFSRATVDFSSADGKKLSVDVGGAQVGAGLRLMF